MSLRILKASAGSGKTFSLTESYVRICLDESTPLDFSNILAITFTNKASGEMKDRIVALLHQLAHDPGSYPGIEGLEKDLKTDRGRISEKSSFLLHKILREFDHFNITTIDSFFTRLYGSLALDLFSEVPREITLDTDLALDEAADALIRNAKEDEDLKDALMDLLEENIKEGKGIHLKNSLRALGNELFRDDYLQLRETGGYVYPEKDFHTALNQQLDLIQLTFEDYQEKIARLIAQAGMQHSDFTRSFTSSILNRKDPQDLLGLAGFSRIIDPEQWFSKAKKDEMEIQVAPVREELLMTGQGFYDFCNDILEKFANYRAVLNNYGSYRILRYLDEALKAYFEENRLISLPAINLKIHQNVKGEDAMVVFEKIGQRLHSVMIDEFQDTARIQWNNLEPFVRNNLAEGYPNLVVGDVKQAIYRFRNGNWEIMELEVPEFQKQWHPEGKSHIENLPYNWRSRPEIIEFNNDLFSELAPAVSGSLEQYLEELIQKYSWDQKEGEVFSDVRALAQAPSTVYGDMRQKVSDANQDKTGYVETEFRYYEYQTDDEVIEEERMKWLYDTILELEGEGFRGADIGILARGKKDLGILADYLSKWSEEHPAFRFSSEDSLKLGLSDGVQLLIAALKVKADLDKEINQLVFKDYYLKLRGERWEKVFTSGEDREEGEESFFDFHHEIEQLYLFFESVIDRTELTRFQGQYPYILSFLEEVKKFELKHGPDVQRFLHEWEQKIQFLRIRMADDEAKIRLFTIHKSKGLEFEVVLLPFARWNFEIRSHETILWESHPEDELLKYAGPLPVRYSSLLLDSSFYKAYISEYYKQVMDNMNLLYVALTRPRQRLYIWLHDKAPKKGSKERAAGEKPLTDTLDLFRAGLENLMPDRKMILGRKIPRAAAGKEDGKDDKVSLRSYPLRRRPLKLRLKPSFDGSGDEAIEEGLLVHRILENVEFSDSVPAAVLKAIQDGEIPEKDRLKWVEKLTAMLQYEPVRPYFEGGWKVYNEKSIMIPGGGEYRPDRIQENGREYVVIDYKTGQKRKEHVKQITTYRKIIAGMVDLPVRSFIFYPHLPEWVEVQ